MEYLEDNSGMAVTISKQSGKGLDALFLDGFPLLVDDKAIITTADGIIDRFRQLVNISSLDTPPPCDSKVLIASD